MLQAFSAPSMKTTEWCLPVCWPIQMKFRDRLTNDIGLHVTLITKLHQWKAHQQPDFLNYLIYDAYEQGEIPEMAMIYGKPTFIKNN